VKLFTNNTVPFKTIFKTHILDMEIETINLAVTALRHWWLSGRVLYDSNFLLGKMVDRKCNLVTVLLSLESGPWSMKIAINEVTVFGDFSLYNITNIIFCFARKCYSYVDLLFGCHAAL
jgi:hypothetical protein